MLQYVAVCCSEVQSLDAVHISLLPRAETLGVWCSEGQYVALCHSALQCAAVIGQSTNVADTSCRFIWSVVQYVAVCCSVLQCVAVCCSALQCVAVIGRSTHVTVTSCRFTWSGVQ